MKEVISAYREKDWRLRLKPRERDVKVEQREMFLYDLEVPEWDGEVGEVIEMVVVHQVRELAGAAD